MDTCCNQTNEWSERHSGGHLECRYKDFEKQLEANGFDELGFGCFRRVYGRGRIVIKVPLNGDGLIDNKIEAMAWMKYKSKPMKNGVRLAPCRLLSNGCLMMVAVSFEDANETPPAWCDDVDSCQIGLYKGNWVAYDYALDVDERTTWEQELGVQSEYFNNEYQACLDAYYEED